MNPVLIIFLPDLNMYFGVDKLFNLITEVWSNYFSMFSVHIVKLKPSK